MRVKLYFLNVFTILVLLITLIGCNVSETSRNTSSIINEKDTTISEFASIAISSTEAASVTSPGLSPSSTLTENFSYEEGTATSSQTKPTKVNDSSNIVFEDESAKIAVKGVGWVPIREAYEKGYIRIKIINGIAYHVSNMNGVDYIRPADIDTGISYDLESPIVFTYADGTTGTEKRDGATYEYLPGMVYTYEAPKDGTGRLIGDICLICGNPISSSSVGTACVQYTRDSYCSCCGVFVKAYTCHICADICTDTSLYCSHCGKVEGNGTNGSCVRWLMGDVDCPNCGVHVTVRTCHTCN